MVLRYTEDQPKYADKPLYIVWTDKLCIGVNIIDEQHRGLVCIINTFYHDYEIGASISTLRATLKMLEEYAAIHFETEERILESINYPNLEEHKIKHAELLLKTQQMQNEVQVETDSWKIIPFLKRWWIEHIFEEDRQFEHVFK
ncbi:bacteriohemerythrin [Endozoicomonas ascidiicola]|uniref:bacteriohemerythrin n=1 Tax=Endozoicomonas ascidiicola TaxID=1698521 RepID=UPI0008346406|nr:hemerythrin family protein [Endozoicomonas ascidiicola]